MPPLPGLIVFKKKIYELIGDRNTNVELSTALGKMSINIKNMG